MPRLASTFFLTAAIFALIGMVWGIQMSATHDHTLSPAHGHLNLIGFVLMSLFGAFYALFPRRSGKWVGPSTLRPASAGGGRPCPGDCDCHQLRKPNPCADRLGSDTGEYGALRGHHPAVPPDSRGLTVRAAPPYRPAQRSHQTREGSAEHAYHPPTSAWSPPSPANPFAGLIMEHNIPSVCPKPRRGPFFV